MRLNEFDDAQKEYDAETQKILERAIYHADELQKVIDECLGHLPDIYTVPEENE
jgi:hypothetical protein